MITVSSVNIEPQKFTLDADESGESYIVVKPATLAQEGQRYEMLFSDSDRALGLDVVAAEIWLSLVECNIQDENGQPIFRDGQDFDHFMAALTAIWNFSSDLVWEIHDKVLQVNPQWARAEEKN